MAEQRAADAQVGRDRAAEIAGDQDRADDGRARFHGKYMVVKIDGEMRLEQGFVRFRGEDPGFLWRKKATEYIQGKLKSYLDPKTTLGDLPRGK